MSEKLPPVLNACLSTGAVLAGVVGYLLMPPTVTQVIATAFTGPAPTHGAPNAHPEIRRIQAEAAKALPNAMLIDVRSQAEYEAGHIPGSTWIPFEKVPLMAATLPKGRPLVLYCT